MIQILDLLDMYFDAVVVEVETFLLLFKLALAILCHFSIDFSYKDLVCESRISMLNLKLS